MRVALLSDIHANWHALETIDNEIKTEIDEYWFLGDLVGYNPMPVECVEWLQGNQSRSRWVVGNHDAELVRLPVALSTGERAKKVIDHHRGLLNSHMAWYQQNFDMDHIFTHYDDGDHRFVMVHGAPLYKSEVTHYLWPHKLFTFNLAYRNLAERLGLKETTWVLHGHHHFPMLYKFDGQQVEYLNIPYDQTISLSGGTFFINPGSVGQPRDGDNRAAYAVLDTEAGTIRFRRVGYRYDKVQRQMNQANNGHNVYDTTLIKLLHTAKYGEENLPAYQRIYDDRDKSWGKRSR